MKYNCRIIDIEEEEITISIEGKCIIGFANCGVKQEIGEEALVDIFLYDVLNVTECNERNKRIERKGKTFKYSLFGILDVDNTVLKSVINFDIDEEELFDYGYLDGKQVRIDVLRIDFDFE